MALPWWLADLWQPFKWTASNTRAHSGIDKGMACGTPVSSPASGTVIHSGDEGWGGQVDVLVPAGEMPPGYDQSSPYVLSFLHLSRQDVQSGHISAGQQVGLSGQPPPGKGFGSGCHLHFEVTHGDQPPYVSAYNPWYPTKSSYPVNGQPFIDWVTSNGTLSAPVGTPLSDTTSASSSGGGFSWGAFWQGVLGGLPVIGGVIQSEGWAAGLEKYLANALGWIANPVRIIKVVVGVSLILISLWVTFLPELAETAVTVAGAPEAAPAVGQAVRTAKGAAKLGPSQNQAQPATPSPVAGVASGLSQARTRRTQATTAQTQAQTAQTQSVTAQVQQAQVRQPAPPAGGGYTPPTFAETIARGQAQYQANEALRPAVQAYHEQAARDEAQTRQAWVARAIQQARDVQAEQGRPQTGLNLPNPPTYQQTVNRGAAIGAERTAAQERQAEIARKRDEKADREELERRVRERAHSGVKPPEAGSITTETTPETYTQLVSEEVARKPVIDEATTERMQGRKAAIPAPDIGDIGLTAYAAGEPERNAAAEAKKRAEEQAEQDEELRRRVAAALKRREGQPDVYVGTNIEPPTVTTPPPPVPPHFSTDPLNPPPTPGATLVTQCVICKDVFGGPVIGRLHPGQDVASFMDSQGIVHPITTTSEERHKNEGSA